MSLKVSLTGLSCTCSPSDGSYYSQRNHRQGTYAWIPLFLSISDTQHAEQVYTVIIGDRLQCTCHDYQIRKCHCKHILYILLKELKIRDLSMEIFATLFPSDEVRTLYLCVNECGLEFRANRSWKRHLKSTIHYHEQDSSTFISSKTNVLFTISHKRAPLFLFSIHIWPTNSNNRLLIKNDTKD